MKFLAIVSLLASMAFTAANAKEVFVQEFQLSTSPGPYSGTVHSDARFYVDTAAAQGLMDVNAYEYYQLPPVPRCTPYHCDYEYPAPTMWTLLDAKVEVPGLVVEGKNLVYRGEDGDVLCATLSRTRWLGNLQINLTGKCEFRTRYNYLHRTLRASFHVQ